MLFVVWGPAVFQLLIPLSLIASVALGHPSSRSAWMARAGLAGSYVFAIGVGGLWLILPWFTPFVYGVLLLFAIAYSIGRVRTLPPYPASGRACAGPIVAAMLAVSLAGLSGYMMSGWRTPPGAVDLAFPLRSGTYLVVNGGGNELINAHYKTIEGQRFHPWRGQSNGVDIEKLNRLGLRARGLLPARLSAYGIFGEPLYTPCAGKVIVTQEGVEEMTPPEMDRRNMAGNYVVLSCGRAWVVLGHLQKGSVRVRQGDRLEEGQLLGQVGNTGNSGEPHLHIHAQRPGTEQAPLSGEPLPIRFEERFPVRNARILAPGVNR
jgi:hypothetical protein